MLFFLFIRKTFFRRYASQYAFYAWLARLRIIRNQGKGIEGWKAKWRLLLSSLSVLKLLIFKLKITNKKNMVMAYGSNKASRAYFLNQNFGWKKHNTIFFNLNDEVCFYTSRYLWYRHFYAIIVVYILILFKALDLFIGKTQYDHAWFTKMLILTAQVCLAPKDFTYIYFNLFTLQSYLAASFADYFGASYMVSFSNTLLLDANRYTFLPAAKGLLCSAIQQSEANAFEENDWFMVGTLQLCKSEDGLMIDALEKKPIAYDLGIYSSGFWARDPRGIRIPIDQLKQASTCTHKVYDVFLNYILLPAIYLKRSQPHLRIKVYPHPYERFLFSQHKVSPPYALLLSEADIEIDLTGSDSLSEIYACRVGVSITSTIISDRLALGLEGFYLNNKNEAGEKLHDFFDGRYLGEYKKHLIDSQDWFERYFTTVSHSVK